MDKMVSDKKKAGSEPEETWIEPNIILVKVDGRQGFICALAENIELKSGDYCIISEYSREIMAQVKSDTSEIKHRCHSIPVRKVIRIADKKDIQAYQKKMETERDAVKFCIDRIHIRGLKMKLVKVEQNNEEHKLIFYYTAEARVDFRELVKDLAARFKTRIEMRQIGVRDESKLLTGCGICGREFCCSTFLYNFAPISIRMAKRQNVNLNPAKISGICGRLMCCLGFEIDESIKREYSNHKITENNDIVQPQIEKNPEENYITTDEKPSSDKTDLSNNGSEDSES